MSSFSFTRNDDSQRQKEEVAGVLELQVIFEPGHGGGERLRATGTAGEQPGRGMGRAEPM
jgi:hypothetical protein